MRSTARLTEALRGRSKAVISLGAAAALAGAGTALATSASAAPPHPAAAISRPAAAVSHPAPPARHPAAVSHPAAASHPAAQHAAARPAVHHGPARPAAHHLTALPVASHAPAHPAAPHQAARHAAHVSLADLPWSKLRVIVARRADPGLHGSLPLPDRLKTGPASGPQEFMPLTSAQLGNASTIVRQALDKRMGVRSAVIAVATSLQESGLLNLSYGDRDSMGLFQQRPSMGWGTPAQVTDPAFAADSFLSALQHYQAVDPGWASQPLWQAAQGVQNSGFPMAYAKWEDQAAQIVANAARRLL